MRLKSSNPVFGSTFEASAVFAGYGNTMTIAGTANKAGILMLLVLLTAAYTWGRFFDNPETANVSGFMMIGLVGGFISAMVTIFKKEWSAVTAPIYALFEGLALGGISATMEYRFPGIAIQAVSLTFGTCFCLLLAYRMGIIKASEKLTMGIVAATGGIALVYFANMLLGIFGVHIPGIFGSGPIGILFSLVVVVVAAMNLILDFAFIEDAAYRGAPKYMEWYGAFGLMVTLIWLYLEMIRLLSKLRDDRN